MDSNNIAQLAGDTTLFAEDLESFKKQFTSLLDCSRDLYQLPNLKKTFYCHFSQIPNLDAIQINDSTIISSVNASRGHK